MVHMKTLQEKPVSTRYPLDVLETMKQLAQEHERSFNGEVVWALRLYITQQQKEGKSEQSPAPEDEEAHIMQIVAQLRQPTARDIRNYLRRRRTSAEVYEKLQHLIQIEKLIGMRVGNTTRYQIKI